jgi:hypothetical protein
MSLPGRVWDDWGREYLHALVLAGYSVRALPMSPVDFQDPRSAWRDLSRFFLGDLEATYLNVICGDVSDCHRLFTVGAIANIAITACHPRQPTPEDAHALGLFDLVLCPSQRDADELVALGVSRAEHVPAKPDAIRPHIERFLHDAHSE